MSVTMSKDVIISEWVRHCPKCGERMLHVKELCGCDYYLCQSCGFRLTEKTCRMHLAEMLR